METQNACSIWRSTLRPSQQKRKAASQGNQPVRRFKARTPSSAPGVIGNRTVWHVPSSHSNRPHPVPSQTAKSVPRVHNYALKIPWAQAEARPGHVPQCGSTAPGAVHLYNFLSFRTLLSGSPFRQSDCWTHYGKEIQRRQEAKTYKGIPRWSLITIEIPVLNTHTQLAPG